MRIAILTSRREKPSYRFRVQQFLPYLEAHGVHSETHVVPRAVPRRWRLLNSLGRYDIVFVQKKPLHPIDRLLLRRAARRIVYDVDDAIMYRDDGRRVRLSPRKKRMFRGMVRMSDAVLAGNEFLCGWAANYTTHVLCFRTVVDTDFYTPRPPLSREPLVIGWSGSASTRSYLAPVIPVLERLARQHPIVLRVVCDVPVGVDMRGVTALRAEFIPWSAATEVSDLHGFDIGLMPLPDHEIARGKCALKALLYMACGIPPVCSPIGAAARIIRDGENGFLASSPEEWHRVMERLVRDASLREGIAARARHTVVAHYSLARQAPRMLRILRDLDRNGEAS